MKKWSSFCCLSFLALGSLYSEEGLIDQEAVIQRELPKISANWIVDRYASPYVGAEDLIAFHYLLQKTEDWMIPPKLPPREGFFPILGRALELALIWNPINEVLVTTQHEVFGHGYRIRTLEDIQVYKYKINTPVPYGGGGGATYFEVDDKLTMPKLQTVVIGGFDAEAVMAKHLKMKWIQAGYIEPRAASLYTGCAQSLVLYSLATSHSEVIAQALSKAGGGVGDVGIGVDDDEGMSGNDIKDYITILNALYPDEQMSRGKLDKSIYFNLLDPMTLYTGLASGIIYMAYGRGMTIPMIHIGEVHFLPNAKVQLAPYGLEYYLENYLLYDDRPIYTYIKTGSYNDVDYYGAGFECEEMFRFDEWSLGMIVDTWYQPKFLVNWTLKDYTDGIRPAIDGLLQDRSFGAAVSLISKWKVFGDRGPMLYSSVGYKTRGYLQGEDLKASPILRVGFSGDF